MEKAKRKLGRVLERLRPRSLSPSPSATQTTRPASPSTPTLRLQRNQGSDQSIRPVSSHSDIGLFQPQVFADHADTNARPSTSWTPLLVPHHELPAPENVLDPAPINIAVLSIQALDQPQVSTVPLAQIASIGGDELNAGASTPDSPPPVAPVVVLSPATDPPSLTDLTETREDPPAESLLWRQAFNKLSENGKSVFSSLSASKQEILGELLHAAQNNRDIYQGERSKFCFRGKIIVVRDVVDKLIAWVDKFKNIGDIVAGCNPVYAGPPWVVIRFLLQITVNRSETMAAVIIGVETIARLLVRCAIYERLYLGSGSRLPASTRGNLENSIEELYTDILEFLAFAKGYLEKSSFGRAFDGFLDVQWGSRFDPITEKELAITKDVAAAEAQLRSHDQKILEDGNEELRDALEEMEKPITRIDSNVALMYQQFQDHTQRERQGEILKWLSQIEYERHHRNSREGLLENSGRWLLEREEFREWRSSSSSSILWLRGNPGAGKTKLTCMIIDFLQPPPQSHEAVVYFYCNRNDPRRRDSEILMQAIVKQLSLVLPDSGLPKPLVEAYEKREKRGFAAGSLGFQESCDLLVLLLNIYPQTTIIIDALDETEQDERWRLVRSLKAAIDLSTSLVKIFISSRNDPDIRRILEKVPKVYIEATDNSGDIERFVTKSINSGQFRANITDQLKQEIISTIARQANGMFQWANLQIYQLSKMSFERDIKENLGKLPKTLEATYSQILEDIYSEATYARRVTRRALMWIMCSRTSLSKIYWAEASYWPDPIPEGGIDGLFDHCHNLVTWDKQLNRVIFTHLSVQEYLEKHSEYNPVEANTMAATSCLSILNNPTETGIFAQAHNFAYYSIDYWPHHVERSYEGSMDNKILSLLKCFLGAPGNPGQAYCRWLQIVKERGYTRTGSAAVAYEHLRSTPPNPFFALSYFRFGELRELWNCDSFDSNGRNDRGETLLLVASARGNEQAIDYLSEKGADVNTGNRRYGLYPLMEAVRGGQAKAVVKLLQMGAVIAANDGRYTSVLEAVAAEGNAATMKAVISRDMSVDINKDNVLAAAQNETWGKKSMKPLLADASNIKITEAALVAAARNLYHGNGIVETFLARDTSIKITEAALVAAISNRYCGKEIVEMFLARNASIEITEVVLAAAVGNLYRGKEIVEMFLARDASIEITEAVLVAAVGNLHHGKKIVETFLARDTSIEITEAALVAAIRNRYCGKEIMEMFLARDASIEITEVVLAAAVGNPCHGKEIVEMFLARDVSIEITEVVLVAAARNLYHGKKIVETLLARDASVEITEAVLVAAMENKEYGKQILEMFLARDASIKITEAALVAAAGNPKCGKGILEMSLARDTYIKITEAVTAAAAGNAKAGHDIFDLLLTRDANIEITEAVATAAANNPECGRTIMEILHTAAAVNAINATAGTQGSPRG